LKLIDDVSARTVAGLNEKIGIEQTTGARSDPRSANPQAYEQYLRARALNGSFLPEQLNAQIAALKRAIALDPQFAAAYADLATTLSLAAARALVSPEEFAQAEGYARQAVRLDPNLPEAHLALGRVFIRDPARFRESVREVLAALRLETTDTQALYSLVSYFVSTGDLQKAQCVGERLVQIDPLSNEALTRGYWNVNAIDPEGAIENAQHAMSNKNTELAGHDIRGTVQLVPRHYLGKSLKAMIAAAKGDRNAALAAVRTFEADAMRNHWAALRVALVYAKLGDNAKSLEWLRRCADLGNHSWYALIKHPWLQPLQSTPEYQEIVTKIKEDLDDVRDDVIGVYQLMCK